jgi:hypothetical protein
MAHPTHRTSDGYTFHFVGGRWHDHPNPAKSDMSFPKSKFPLPKPKKSGQDDALLGTRGGKPGGHAGYGSQPAYGT